MPRVQARNLADGRGSSLAVYLIKMVNWCWRSKDQERQLALVGQTRAHLRHQPVEVRRAARINPSAADLQLSVARCHNVLSESHPALALQDRGPDE
jgi:hypothetical protein